MSDVLDRWIENYRKIDIAQLEAKNAEIRTSKKYSGTAIGPHLTALMIVRNLLRRPYCRS